MKVRGSHVKRAIEWNNHQVPGWAGCVRDADGKVVLQCLHFHRQKFGFHRGIPAESCGSELMRFYAEPLQRQSETALRKKTEKGK